MSRRDPSLEDIVKIDRQGHATYAPNYHWSTLDLYVKGHNGHYYMQADGDVIRLYTKNQVRASDVLGRIRLADRPDSEIREVFLKMVIDHRPRHKVAKIVDRQRTTCYKWERDVAAALRVEGKYPKDLNQLQAIALIQQISKDHGVKGPRTKFSQSGSHSWAKEDYEIKILVNTRNEAKLITIIHEMAHIVEYAKNRIHPDCLDAGHGPKFIGMYIDMLVKYAGLDKDVLETSAINAGLKIERIG